MGNKAKLFMIALILSFFSIGAVAASENLSLESSDFNSVSYETPVSASLDLGLINVDSSDSECNQTSLEIVDNVNASEDFNLSSDDVNFNVIIEVKSVKKSLLGVSNNDDILGRTIIPTGTTFDHIRQAINSARDGDIIDLGGKTYTGTNANIQSSKKITIQNGILDGSAAASDFHMNLPGVNVKNVEFTNFHGQRGQWQRLFSFSGSTLENLKFSNSSHDSFMGLFAGFYGLNATNITFENIVSGTCVLDMASANLMDSKFINSRVTDSVKDRDTGQFTVMVNSVMDNCTFINTSSQQHSGAICMAKGENTVINSNFINCSAWVGGAIYAHGDFSQGNQKYTIENCTFINCTAEEEGGALGLSHNNMDVKNCEFINNTATKGAGIMIGGIYHPTGIDGDNSHGHNITIDNCYFEKNIASEEGGAVHISGDNNRVIGSEFYYNEAPEGGAVHITGDNAVAKDSIFDDNMAHGGNGSAIYIYGENSSVINSEFYNHDCSNGTVYIIGNNASIDGSTFENNTASNGGAGVYVVGDDTLVNNSVFNNNSAIYHGGAIHSQGDNLIITNSNFTSNTAIASTDNLEQGLGGAVFINGNNSDISFSYFENNIARNGSAVYRMNWNHPCTN